MLVLKPHALFIPRVFRIALIAAAAVSLNPASAHPAHSALLGQVHGGQVHGGQVHGGQVHGGHGSGKKLPFGEPGKASEADRTVGVYVDGMKYGLSATNFEAGETVRFVIVNSSPIAHDFTLGDAATQRAHRRDMETRMKTGAMSGDMNHDDANAVFLKQGDVKEIVWKFSSPGKFMFACNIPGHYEAGMYGYVNVNG